MVLDSEMSQPSTSAAVLTPASGSVSELRRKRSKMQDGYGDARWAGLG